MSSVKKSLVVLSAAMASALGAGHAQAADMPAPPPLIYRPMPAPVPEFSGWYLRGDIGMTNQRVRSADNVQIATATGFEWIDPMSFDSGMLFGIGVGYLYNDWLRFDLTGEYRGKTALRGLDHYTSGGNTFTNNYNGTKSEWLFLANAYADLGTWWCITPFIGAGIGLAHITLDNFRDDNIIAAGGGYANAGSKTNFAWAVHAGLAYKVTSNFSVELAYRYVDLGDGVTGDVINYSGANTINNPWTFKNITSHDVKLGLRWVCCDTDTQRAAAYTPQPSYVPPPPQQQVLVAPAPVYQQPAPVYQQPAPAYPQPAPGYSQPPLMRKG